MTNQTRTLLIIAFSTLVVILVVIGLITHLTGGSDTVPVAGAAAAVAAAAALASGKKREEATAKVDEAEKLASFTAQGIENLEKKARLDAEEAVAEADKASPEEKAKAGDDLFGPPGGKL